MTAIDDISRTLSWLKLVPWPEPVLTATDQGVRRLRDAWRASRNLLCSGATIGVRRRFIGEPTCRLLTPADVDGLLAFAGQYSWVDPAYLARQLATTWTQCGAAAGAFDSRGRMIAMGLLDEYRNIGLPIDGWWIRAIAVRPFARGLNLGHDLVKALCREAVRQGIPTVRAAIAPDNVPSLRLFQRAGFRPTEAAAAERIRQTWRAHEPTQEWRIVEWHAAATSRAVGAQPQSA